MHCWGGVGRTGTLVGWWLVRHGCTGDGALAEIAKRWQGVEKICRQPRSPNMRKQREYIWQWRESSQEESTNG